MFPHRKLAFLLALSGLAAAGSVLAASGTVTFVTGDVSVQRKDGTRVAAAKGTVINAGDTVVTREKAMAQVAMVDQAKLSLRPNTQVQVEQYADRPDSDQGASLNLLRGTMRTFTGLIAQRNRDKFVMKTKVATVGIRGSGNVLFAGVAADCDPAKVDGAESGCDITVNHTIEGSHAVTFGAVSGTGLPAQQGGAQTLITGPGQTVLVTGRGDVRYIPTPQFIADSATNPTGAAKATSESKESTSDTRNFGPNDSSSYATLQDNLVTGQATTPPVQTFPITDNSGNLAGGEPLGLQDIVIAGDSTIAGQALQGDIRREGTSLRGYRMYPGLQVGLAPSISGGVAQESRTHTSGDLNIFVGRWEGASLGFFGQGSESLVSGSVHWILSGSGFPAYLSDVLTGTARYTPVVSTSPTNQVNNTGSLTSAQLDVNFTTRRLDASFAVTMSAGRGNAGGSWQLTASDVPFSFGTFFASTSDRLRITNGTGQSSQVLPSLLSGSMEGSFVGAGMQGAIVGYSLTDETLGNPAHHNTVNGVVGFQGPQQNGGAQYRDGLVSDPSGVLASALVRNFSTANRPDEVTLDAQGRVTAFAAPYRNGGHQSYALGTASVAQAGTDPDTGLVWGRWAGGAANVSGGGSSQTLNLERQSLHYVFSGQQNGPVSLPLTGTANYTLIGSTSPTDSGGNVGTLNNASLAANFTQRTVNLGVNLSITGQTINATAVNVPIYREQYFTAFAGNVPAGLPIPQLLNISCQPTCAGAAGSVDGFFAGRSGQGAGMMYNLNGVSGAAAFRRAGS